MITIRTIDQLNLTAQKVFYRVDYNVPLEGDQITDATRIEETIATLHMLRERGTAAILASHLGRPKGQRNEKYSLKPVHKALQEMIGLEVQWADDCVGAEAEEKAANLRPGQLLLLENLRFHPGEEKNDQTFAAQLRKLGEAWRPYRSIACWYLWRSLDNEPMKAPPTRKENSTR